MAERTLGMSKEDLDWLGRAACKGSDPNLFTVKDLRLQPGETGLEAKQKLAENEKFKRAIKVCRNCTVQQECGESAEPEDFQWTVRAGKMPGAFNTRGRGRPQATLAPVGDNTCKNGHYGRLAKRSAGGYRCYDCENEAKEPKPVELKEECENGHVGMYEREKYIAPGRKQGKRFCRGCKRMNRNGNRHAYGR